MAGYDVADRYVTEVLGLARASNDLVEVELRSPALATRLMCIAGIDDVGCNKCSIRTTEYDKSSPPQHPDRLDRSCSMLSLPGSVAGKGLHICVDAAKGVPYHVLCGRVLPPHPGLAGDDQQDRGCLVTSVLEQTLLTPYCT
ncbi:hypothetical protein [Mycobacterium leprae]|nr:hypothetical protein [Mycobacterium leprae]OAX70758.1 hypothetical protein A3216_10145 [Mycobacterium leprae 7935681]